jgi:hypothetical protein
MKIIDVIGVVLIVLGISITVLTFIAARQPIADVQSFTVHEIAPRGMGGNIFEWAVVSSFFLVHALGPRASNVSAWLGKK